MKIRSITISSVEWDEQVACDVNIRFTSNDEMTIPTRLYDGVIAATAAADIIKGQVLRMSESQLDAMYEEYLSKQKENPFKDILYKIRSDEKYDGN